MLDQTEELLTSDVWNFSTQMPPDDADLVSAETVPHEVVLRDLGAAGPVQPFDETSHSFGCNEQRRCKIGIGQNP